RHQRGLERLHARDEARTWSVAIGGYRLADLDRATSGRDRLPDLCGRRGVGARERLSWARPDHGHVGVLGHRRLSGAQREPGPGRDLKKLGCRPAAEYTRPTVTHGRERPKEEKELCADYVWTC